MNFAAIFEVLPGGSPRLDGATMWLHDIVASDAGKARAAAAYIARPHGPVKVTLARRGTMGMPLAVLTLPKDGRLL